MSLHERDEEVGKALHVVVRNMARHSYKPIKFLAKIEGLDTLLHTAEHDRPVWIAWAIAEGVVPCLVDCLRDIIYSPHGHAVALSCLSVIVKHDPSTVDRSLVAALCSKFNFGSLGASTARLITLMVNLRPQLKDDFKDLRLDKEIVDCALLCSAEEGYQEMIRAAEAVYKTAENKDVFYSDRMRRKRDLHHVALALVVDDLKQQKMPHLTAVMGTWLPVLSRTLTESVDNDTQAGGLACKMLGLVFKSLPGPSPLTVVEAGLVPHILKHLMSQSRQVVLRTLKCIAFIVNAAWPDHPSVCKDFIDEGALHYVGELLRKDETVNAAYWALQRLVSGNPSLAKQALPERVSNYVQIHFDDESRSMNVRYLACSILLEMSISMTQERLEEIVEFLIGMEAEDGIDAEATPLARNLELALDLASTDNDLGFLRSRLKKKQSAILQRQPKT